MSLRIKLKQFLTMHLIHKSMQELLLLVYLSKVDELRDFIVLNEEANEFDSLETFVYFRLIEGKIINKENY